MLTDAHCRAAKPKEQLYRLNDLRGLYLEVKPNGVKAWRYRFKLGGKGSWFALGDYPTVSLAEARDKCEEARKLVKQGINPVQNRQLERLKREQDSANTFEAVAKEWLALRDWEDITKKRRLDMLERVVFPSLGKLPVCDIAPAHVLDILTKTVKRGAPTVAAEAKRTMSGIFELAVATLRADNDPVWPVRKALPANKTQHKMLEGFMGICFRNGHPASAARGLSGGNVDCGYWACRGGSSRSRPVPALGRDRFS